MELHEKAMELHEKAMELQWRYTGIFHGDFMENQVVHYGELFVESLP